MSLALRTDSYKASHFLQFPPNTREMFYYVEPRIPDKEIKVFGLQMIIKKHFMTVPTIKEIAFAANFWADHGVPFNVEGWEYINKLGYLPLEIRTVPEGTVVPSQNIIASVRSTDPNCFWLPGWMETLTMQLWYPTTVATISYECKKVINAYLQETGTPEDIAFKLHDFGYRGATSEESAGIYGAAHLVNFMGTDTVAGILAAQKYYNTTQMVGRSIPAAEHSTVISWGKEREKDAYENMLTQFAREGKIVAVVSDSYSLSNAVENIWCKELKQQVLDSGATIVIRPDSGDPAEIVVRTLKQLEQGFGTTLIKGYKVLNPAVRVIQGDGISDAAAIDGILSAVKASGFSADNLTFGMGGGLAQKCDRDTLMFAEKNSAIKIDNYWYDVCKTPEDAPWKASKAGVLDLTPDFKTVNLRGYDGPSAMQAVFKNGDLFVDETFETIRAR